MKITCSSLNPESWARRAGVLQPGGKFGCKHQSSLPAEIRSHRSYSGLQSSKWVSAGIAGTEDASAPADERSPAGLASIRQAAWTRSFCVAFAPADAAEGSREAFPAIVWLEAAARHGARIGEKQPGTGPQMPESGL